MAVKHETFWHIVLITIPVLQWHMMRADGLVFYTSAIFPFPLPRYVQRHLADQLPDCEAAEEQNDNRRRREPDVPSEHRCCFVRLE